MNEINSIDIGVLITEQRNGQAVIVDVNDVELTNNGFTRDELIGKNPVDCFDLPETEKDVITRAQKSVEQGKSAHFTARIKRKDGTPYAISCIVTGGYNEDRNAFQYKYYATVIDSDDPALDTFARSNIREMSEKMSGTGSWRYSDICKELLISKNVYAIFDLNKKLNLISQMTDRLPKDITSAIHKAIGICLSRGEPFSINYHFHSNGGTLYHGTMGGEPEHDESGAIIAVVGIVRDLTLQTNLEYENGMFLRAAKLGSLQVDDKNKVLTLSPQAANLLGYEEKQIQIKTEEWRDKIHPDDREQAVKIYGDSLKSRETVIRCYRLRHQDDSWRWFEIRSQVRYDEQEKPVILYATMMDIHDRMLTERQLTKSEERFNDVLSQTKEAIFELNAQGVFTYISEMGPIMLGYSIKDFMRMTPYNLMPEPPISKEEWLTGLSKGDSFERLKHFARKDGSMIDVQVNFMQLKDDAGEIIGFRGAARDVTEQRKIRTKLEKSEARYKEVINTADGCMFETDANGCFTYICETSENLFGYRPEEIIGKPTYFLSTAPKEGHEAWLKALHASGRFNVQEKKMSPKNGNNNSWLRITGRSIEDEAGVIIGFRGAIFDISERKRNAEKIRETGERLKEVIRAAGGLTFDLDEEGKFSFISSRMRKTIGSKNDELLGKHTWVLAPDLKPFHKDWLKNLRQSDGGYSREFRLKDEKTWLEVHCVARWDDDGNCFGYRGVAFDITKKKNAEQELRRAKKQAEAAAEERTRFLATMSHEIRTPLNAVIGMTDLLLDSEQSQQQNKLTKTANMAGRHLLNLVNDILDHAKLDAGKVALEEIPFELRTELQNVHDILNAKAEEKNIHLQMTLASDLSKFYVGDAARIRQILLNLVGNAIKFTDNGSVTITALPANNGQVRFEIADTGMGISKDIQQNLFQDFAQADASITRKHGGTGLGLAICKRLVGVMGGEIGVISDEGAGACFWFEIPMYPYQPKQNNEHESDTANDEPIESAQFNVLVAEDNPANQLLIRTLLEKLNQNITVVENGKLAVEAATAHSFDLILMDMQMPVMDGYTATKTLRELGNQTPIIALTAHMIKDEEQKFRDAGMDDWLSKPFQIHDLVKRLYHWGNVSRMAQIIGNKEKTG